MAQKVGMIFSLEAPFAICTTSLNINPAPIAPTDFKTVRLEIPGKPVFLFIPPPR
jgi:hypothetical protein